MHGADLSGGKAFLQLQSEFGRQGTSRKPQAQGIGGGDQQGLQVFGGGGQTQLGGFLKIDQGVFSAAIEVKPATSGAVGIDFCAFRAQCPRALHQPQRGKLGIRLEVGVKCSKSTQGVDDHFLAGAQDRYPVTVRVSLAADGEGQAVPVCQGFYPGQGHPVSIPEAILNNAFLGDVEVAVVVGRLDQVVVIDLDGVFRDVFLGIEVWRQQRVFTQVAGCQDRQKQQEEDEFKKQR